MNFRMVCRWHSESNCIPGSRFMFGIPACLPPKAAIRITRRASSERLLSPVLYHISSGSRRPGAGSRSGSGCYIPRVAVACRFRRLIAAETSSGPRWSSSLAPSRNNLRRPVRVRPSPAGCWGRRRISRQDGQHLPYPGGASGAPLQKVEIAGFCLKDEFPEDRA
jgi:hypothetical protein